VESSLATHASEQCRSACAYFCVVLAALVSGHAREDILVPENEIVERISAEWPLHPEIAAIARGSFREKQPPEIQGSGYVVRSLEAARWAFHQASSFEEAVLLAVNIGDDADTTGAICGQLAGAYWGESGIPTHLRNGLARKDMIEQALARLLENRRTSNRAHPIYDRPYL